MVSAQRRLFSVVVLGLVCTFWLAIACGPGFLDGLSGGSSRDGGAADGETSTAVIDGAVTCNPAKPPDRPEGGAGAGGGTIHAVFAARALRADSRDVDASAPPPRGFDLDGFCTCPGERACVPVDAAAPQCDLENGRDNVLSQSFNQIAELIAQFSEDFLTTRIEKGQYTLLVDVRDWNGLPDDDSIVVTLLTSQGLDEAASNRKDPIFDGTDVWTIDPDSLSSGALGADCRNPDSLCVAKPERIARSGKAWLSGGTLVAHFASAPLYTRTIGGVMLFDFDDLMLVGKIDGTIASDGGVGTHHFEGELVGRWPIERVLKSLGDLENLLVPGSRVCNSDAGSADSPLSPSPENVCAALDLPATGASGSPGAGCTALSAAISVVAVETREPSLVRTRNEPPSDCPVPPKDICNK